MLLISILITTLFIILDPIQSYSKTRDAQIRRDIAEISLGISEYGISKGGIAPKVRTGDSLPVVTTETIASIGVDPRDLEGINPDYLQYDESLKLGIRYFVGQLDFDKILVGSLLSDGSLYYKTIYLSQN